jgi:hypothetical protein
VAHFIQTLQTRGASLPLGMSDDEDMYDDFHEDDTLSEDPRYTEVVVQYDRVFQRYAIDEELYFVPVDPVSQVRV